MRALKNNLSSHSCGLHHSFYLTSYLLVCKKWPEQIINEDAEPAAAAAADLPHALALPPKAEAA
jgi:hypothetical protein